MFDKASIATTPFNFKLLFLIHAGYIKTMRRKNNSIQHHQMSTGLVLKTQESLLRKICLHGFLTRYLCVEALFVIGTGLLNTGVVDTARFLLICDDEYCLVIGLESGLLKYIKKIRIKAMI